LRVSVGVEIDRPGRPLVVDVFGGVQRPNGAGELCRAEPGARRSADRLEPIGNCFAFARIGRDGREEAERYRVERLRVETRLAVWRLRRARVKALEEAALRTRRCGSGQGSPRPFDDDVRDHDIAPAAVEGARGTLPGATAPSPEGRFFERLYAGSPEPPHSQPGFDAEAFDAVTLCFLAAVAAGSSEGEAIADRLEAVSAPPGARFGPAELAGAVRALHAAEDIDYQGASGPIDFDANGDPQTAAFEAFSYRDGRMRRGPAFLARRNP
jgi:hypothetical protein